MSQFRFHYSRKRNYLECFDESALALKCDQPRGRHYVAAKRHEKGDLVLACTPLVIGQYLGEKRIKSVERIAALAHHILEQRGTGLGQRIMAHLASLRQDTYRGLLESSTPWDAEMLMEVLGRFIMFTQEGDTHLLGAASYFRHNCRPNVVHSYCAANGIHEYRALMDIPEGAELCISYIAFPMDSKGKRWRTLNFACECETCERNLMPSSHVITIRMRGTLDENCWWCGKHAKQTCERCGVTRYCSAKCAQKNAKQHENVCEYLSQ